MQLNQKTTLAFLKALQALSDEHGLGLDAAALTAAQQEPHPQDASFYLETVFAHRTVSHAEEQGEAPSGAYPRLLVSYAEASGGAFAPTGIEVDSGDDWDSLTLTFQHAGKKQRITVNGVEDSDWFSADFVSALNRFARRADLSGRWVDFHNGDDACTSIYVPHAAQKRFVALQKKYSSVAEADGDFSATDDEAFESLHAAENGPAPLHLQDKKAAARGSDDTPRAAQWQDVKARLEYQRRHTKKEIKIFEKFFVKGEEPEWLFGIDPIPLIYRLWFSPDSSQEAWHAIVDNVFAYPRLAVENSIRETWTLLNQALGSDSYCGYEGSPIGFIGGKEEAIFKILTGDFSTREFLTHDGERLFVWRVFNTGYYMLMNRWLEHSEYANPYNVFHYMHEFWYEAMSGDFVEDIVRAEDVELVKKYLQLVATGFFKNDVADSGRLAHCQNIVQILENRPVPREVGEWWSEVKESAGSC